jgi:hypothetical protein
MAEIEQPGLTYAPPHWHRGNLRSTAAGRNVGAEKRVSSLLLLGSDADVAIGECFTRMQEILPWAPSGNRLAGLPTAAVYRDLFRRYIRPVEPIERMVDGLAGELFRRRPILAVHYRTQSPVKNSESVEKRALTIADYLPLIDEFMARNPAGGIFLLTDLADAVAAFTQRYQDAVITLPAVRLERAEDVEVTYLRDQDRSILAKEVMRDVYLATRSDAFIGDGASAVSCVIGHLKEWPAGTYRLLREDVTLMPGVAKFDPPRKAAPVSGRAGAGPR